jgi:predicted TIM-barrel fold metal-dependent hydrolase
MSDLFYEVASIDYPIIDSDAHVNEPPDLWQDRIPARFKQRAPRVVKTDQGDVWNFDDGKGVWPLGLTAVSGRSYFEILPFGLSYDEIRPGNFEPKARMRDMDADGIYAAIHYPSITLKGARMYSDDRELQLACVQAYNDWLSEFCEGSDGRLLGLGLIPTTGVDDAVAELERSMKIGHVGVVISSFPNGSLDPLPEDDRFWGLAAEMGVPISVHIGSFMPEDWGPSKEMDWKTLRFIGSACWTKAGGQTLAIVCDLIFAGIWEKFPDLRLVLVEANIGWIPTLLEQSDDMFSRYRWYTEAVDKMNLMPSEIFHHNFYASFMIDNVGVGLRHRMNIDHLIWSTDYPHSGSDWPNSRVTLERNFRGVPKAEVKKMIHGNCKRLYKLDHVPDLKPGR